MNRMIAAAFAAFLAFGAAEAEEAEIHVLTPYAFVTPAGAKAGGVYVGLHNHGPDDRLIAARSDAAERVEIHEHVHEAGVMKMREVSAGLALPAEGKIEMGPGGYHIMLMGLRAPLEAGGHVSVTLLMESGREIDISAPVIERGATPPECHGDCPDDAHKHH